MRRQGILKQRNDPSGGSCAAPETRGVRSDDVCGRLELLRSCAKTCEGSRRLDRIVSDLSPMIERLMTEHAGMANELLSVYEQLGIVFEVTRQLPGVGTEAEVVDLFVDNLRRSFPKHLIFFVYPRSISGGRGGSADRAASGGAPAASGTTEHRAGPDPIHADFIRAEWFGNLVGQARERASVLVEKPPAESTSDHVAEIMVAPVFAGSRKAPDYAEAFVGAIVGVRPHEADAFRAVDMRLFESLATFCGDLIRNHRLVQELHCMLIAIVRSLVNAVDQKDAYTSGHSLRVGYYATLLGEAVGLGKDDLELLRWSALLHDVGKIGIRDEVLKKEGKLTKEEFDHIKEHPVRSHRVVQEVPQLADALHGILHHHEHYDGTGYPAGLSGNDIPLQARIVQIADVFDALTSARSYRPAYDWRKALDILREEAGRTVDPYLQEVFDGLMREKLEGDPKGWKQMVSCANRFTQVTVSRDHVWDRLSRGPESRTASVSHGKKCASLGE